MVDIRPGLCEVCQLIMPVGKLLEVSRGGSCFNCQHQSVAVTFFAYKLQYVGLCTQHTISPSLNICLGLPVGCNMHLVLFGQFALICERDMKTTSLQNIRENQSLLVMHCIPYFYFIKVNDQLETDRHRETDSQTDREQGSVCIYAHDPLSRPTEVT